jgi:hypothetical protein
MDSLAYGAAEAQLMPPIMAMPAMNFLPQKVAGNSAGEDARRTLSSPA